MSTSVLLRPHYEDSIYSGDATASSNVAPAVPTSLDLGLGIPHPKVFRSWATFLRFDLPCGKHRTRILGAELQLTAYDTWFLGILQGRLGLLAKDGKWDQPGAFDTTHYPLYSSYPLPTLDLSDALIPGILFEEAWVGGVLALAPKLAGQTHRFGDGLEQDVPLVAAIQRWIESSSYGQAGDPLGIVLDAYSPPSFPIGLWYAEEGDPGGAFGPRLLLTYETLRRTWSGDETRLANAALILLGEPRIADLNASGDVERLLADRFEEVRDSLLRFGDWEFAKARTRLAARVETEGWGFTKTYDLPADCLRVLAVDNPERHPVQIEGRRLQSDLLPPLGLEYIRRLEDPRLWDARFRQAFAAALALEIVEALTGSSEKALQIAAIFAERMGGLVEDAKSAKEILASEWTDARAPDNRLGTDRHA